MIRKTYRMAKAAIAFHLSLFAFHLSAATTPLASASDYYFTVPGTSNIVGKVMGDGGDYKLVRQEDIAWLREAVAERRGMAAGTDKNTNAIPTLVKGMGFGGLGSGWYNPDVEVVEYCMTNAWSSSTLGGLAGLGVTNINISLANLPSHGLVSIDRITNLYHSVRRARRLVVEGAWDVAESPIECEKTSVATRSVFEAWTEVDENYRVSYHTGRQEGTDRDTIIVGRYEVSSRDFKSNKTIWYAPTLPGGDWNNWDSYYFVSGGSGDSSWNVVESMGRCSAIIKLYQACDTNAWLRGGSRPDRFIENISAWCCAYVSTSHERDLHGTETTNHYALVSLGTPDFAYATNNCLVWSIELDLSYTTGRAVALCNAKDASWAMSAKVNTPPAPEDLGTGYHVPYPEDGGYVGMVGENDASDGEGRSLEAYIGLIYLVIDINPATRLGGW